MFFFKYKDCKWIHEKNYTPCTVFIIYKCKVKTSLNYCTCIFFCGFFYKDSLYVSYACVSVCKYIYIKQIFQLTKRSKVECCFLEVLSSSHNSPTWILNIYESTLQTSLIYPRKQSVILVFLTEYWHPYYNRAQFLVRKQNKSYDLPLLDWEIQPKVWPWISSS